MQFVTKYKAIALAAALLGGQSAWAAGEAETSIIDSLKNSVSSPSEVAAPAAASKPVAAQNPAAAPTAPDASAAPASATREVRPSTGPTVAEVAAAVRQGSSTSAIQQASFPDTKPSNSDAGYPVKTVKELLDLEAKFSLLKSKERFDLLKDEKQAKLGGINGMGLQVKAKPAPPPENLELLAVLGHGDKRFASVYYNGTSMFRISDGARVGPYTISSIAGSCVVLTRESPAKAKAKAKGKKSAAASPMIIERHLCISDNAPMQASAQVFGPGPSMAQSPAIRLNDALPTIQPAAHIFQ